MCAIVNAELVDKGVYNTDGETGELLPTKKRKKKASEREIDIIYFSDPYDDMKRNEKE